MSLDAIKAVTAAEEKARRDKADAQQKSKALIAAAKADGKVMTDNSRAKAEAEVEALMKNAESRALTYAEELRDNTLNKCAAMRAKAETRLDSAAALIARKVVEG